nr:DUF1345 domain-containing protein [Niastella yeongjuensis]
MPEHSRLLISLIFVAVVFVFTRNSLRIQVQTVLLWNCFVLINLCMYWPTIITAQSTEMKTIVRQQDLKGFLVFFFILFSSIVSLFGVIFLLQLLPSDRSWSYYSGIGLSIFSVTFSWVLIHTLFTIRYASQYYIERRSLEADVDNTKKDVNNARKDVENARKDILGFPDNYNPDYLDFAYFSFSIGMTFQTPDIPIASKNIRRLVLIHALLSFGYNTAIVALSINIISGLVKMPIPFGHK